MRVTTRLASQRRAVVAWLGIALAPWPAVAEQAMLSAATGSGFEVRVLFATGDAFDGYRPPGVLDGIVAFPGEGDAIDVFVTHELAPDAGYPYRLANGTELTGARMTRFVLSRQTRRLTGARLAYSAVHDRQGRVVVDPSQLNQRQLNQRGRDGGGKRGGRSGLEGLCSAAGYLKGQFGFVDQLVFVNEEATRADGHPHGGTIYALDVRTDTLWALPSLGRGSFENVAAVATPDANSPDGHVALLIGDDYEFGGAPLYLWIGRKQPNGTLLERNGLVHGELYAWVADNGDSSPQQWSGGGTRRDGRFVRVPARSDPGPGTDAHGYLDDTALRQRAAGSGAFLFSRPEDLHTNPKDPLQVVFASTGQGDVYPADDWGGIYLADLRFDTGGKGGLTASATIRLLYDSDDSKDRGIRSPDNLVWARDGNIYVQEDMATKRGRFGAESGREASIWSLDPKRPASPVLVATIDRSAVPPGATDAKARRIGEWESSGVIDVSELLGGSSGELALLVNVQAHSVTDGAVGGRKNLVQASQLLLLTRK